METAARTLLLVFVGVLLLQVLGVGGQPAASSPGEAAERVTRWLRAKFIGA